MRWQVWVDTGGTFTDCLAVDPGGRLHRAKVLSSSALRGTVTPAEEGRVAFRSELGEPVDDFFRGGRLRRVGLGSTAQESRAPTTRSSTRIVASEGDILHLEAPWSDGGTRAAEVVFAEEAPVLAARVVTGTPGGGELPELELRLATTRGTNALLERAGADVALFVTHGFADLLLIGNQQRPDLFALEIDRPAPLYRRVVEVEERLDARGNVLRALDAERLRRDARELRREGFDCAAVAFLHAYRNPDHEERAAAILAREGFRHVSVSSRLAPRIQILPRAETAVVNAYLSPVIERYVQSVRAATREGELRVMTSSGGLRNVAEFEPKDSLLSGPAGGVVGAAARGRASGELRLIAFDMGGTSTDVSRVGESVDYASETRVGGARILAPALAIETVAAGGGSICRFDGHQLRVGPESAGASPGPACYGSGGPLTLTDVNLLLGRIAADRVAIPLELAAAEQAATALVDSVVAATGERCDRHDALVGLLAIANERMAEAIRRISLRRGYAPERHCLVAFGGAGAQHACALAAALAIERILVPADAGLLSAFGLGAARLEAIVERQVLLPLSAVESELANWFGELERQAVERLGTDAADRGACEVDRRLVALRLVGQETALTVDYGGGDLDAAYGERYRDLYGYEPPARNLEVESLRLVAIVPGWRAEAAVGADAVSRVVAEDRTRQAWLGGAWREWPVFERAALAPGDRFRGPALVEEEHSSSVVERGWSCRVDSVGGLLLERPSEVDR